MRPAPTAQPSRPQSSPSRLIRPVEGNGDAARRAGAGVVPAVRPVREVLGGAVGSALVPVLGATGRVQLVFGAGLAVGLALG